MSINEKIITKNEKTYYKGVLFTFVNSTKKSPYQLTSKRIIDQYGNIYESIGAASAQLKITRRLISNQLNGFISNTHGYKFTEYKNKEGKYE